MREWFLRHDSKTQSGKKRMMSPGKSEGALGPMAEQEATLSLTVSRPTSPMQAAQKERHPHPRAAVTGPEVGDSLSGVHLSQSLVPTQGRT